jgi:hypothetical protein
MTRITNIASRGRPSPKLAVVAIVSALLALGTLAAPASADWDGHHRGYNHHWNGGYYRSPPVVYGSPYHQSHYGSPYYAPPVVYGPGISLPGLNIGIR